MVSTKPALSFASAGTGLEGGSFGGRALGDAEPDLGIGLSHFGITVGRMVGDMGSVIRPIRGDTGGDATSYVAPFSITTFLPELEAI